MVLRGGIDADANGKRPFDVEAYEWLDKAGFASCFVVIAVLRYEVLSSRGHWECFAVTH